MLVLKKMDKTKDFFTSIVKTNLQDLSAIKNSVEKAKKELNFELRSISSAKNEHERCLAPLQKSMIEKQSMIKEVDDMVLYVKEHKDDASNLSKMLAKQKKTHAEMTWDYEVHLQEKILVEQGRSETNSLSSL
jgi:aspartokinase